MAWSDSQRDSFVVAYIDGLREGIGEACSFADVAPDVQKGPASGQGHEGVAECRANTTKYSRCNEGASEWPICSAYTQVITAFYKKHPEYQNIPFEYLMQYLTDKEHRSADDLYSMARFGEMRTHW
jgi:hypothetical protein